MELSGIISDSYYDISFGPIGGLVKEEVPEEEAPEDHLIRMHQDAPKTSTPLKKRKHLCSVCGKEFGRAYNMVRHKRLVHNESDDSVKISLLKCHLCDKSFDHQSRLRSHMNFRHVKQKPYACNVCNKKFSSDFKAKPSNHVCIGPKKEVCTVCNKAFVCNSALKQHIHTHDLTKAFKCQCSQTFKHMSSLKRHQKKCCHN